MNERQLQLRLSRLERVLARVSTVAYQKNTDSNSDASAATGTNYLGVITLEPSGTYLYSLYTNGVAWEAHRLSPEDVHETLTGSGSVPTTLSALRALSWPT